MNHTEHPGSRGFLFTLVMGLRVRWLGAAGLESEGREQAKDARAGTDRGDWNNRRLTVRPGTLQQPAQTPGPGPCPSAPLATS